jgi:dephospho-CoA kinase
VGNRWPGKTVIGLTGNIATGKSIVRRMVEHLGAFSIDADGLAHRAMSPGAPAFQPIVDTFGKWILASDGQIDREKLGNIVFSDAEALKRLEAITHPLISQVIDLLIKRATQKVVVIEAIKLFEGGLADQCDSVWVVDAPEDVQVKRLIEQRKLTEPAARLRVSAQPSQKDKLARAKVVINNGGGYESTWDQVQKQWDSISGTPEKAPEKAPEPVSTPVDTHSAPTLVAGKVPAATVDSRIVIQRGGPKQAEEIATFINKNQNSSLSRMDILQRFGQKAYLLAMAGDQMVGLAGWQVENLIARTDDLIVTAGATEEKIIKELVANLEKSSNELQAEISLIFLKNGTPDAVRRAVLVSGYEQQTAADFRIPDWREAAEESQPADTYMVVKRLRADRVLKPL